MLSRIIAGIVATTVALVGINLNPVTAPAAEAGELVGSSNLQQLTAVFNGLNDYRASKGLPAVRFSPEISKVSQDWGNKMATEDTLYHNPSYFSSYPGMPRSGGKIIAYRGDQDPAKLIQQWVNSPGHEALMVGNFNVAGVGITFSKDYNGATRMWGVINFARYVDSNEITNYPDVSTWVSSGGSDIRGDAISGITSAVDNRDGTVTVKGWAADLSDRAAAANAVITVAGITPVTVTANQSTPSGSPLSSYGITGDHGFSAVIRHDTLTQKLVQVCVLGKNTVGAGADSTSNCLTTSLYPKPVSHDAAGAIVSVTDLGTGKVRVQGWAVDRSDPSLPTSARIWQQSTNKSTVLANLDAPVSPGFAGKHGFSIDVPHGLTETGTVRFCGEALNTVSVGVDAQFPTCVTATVQVATSTPTPTPTPVSYDAEGVITGVTDLGNGNLRVVGWAYDNDRVDAPSKVTLQVVGQEATTVSAAYTTPTAPVAGAHGFVANIRHGQLTDAEVTVTGSALNTYGGGADKALKGFNFSIKQDTKGAITSAKDLGNGYLEVKGWAYDQSDASKASNVTVQVAGQPSLVVVANLATSPATVPGAHGFVANVKHGQVKDASVKVSAAAADSYGVGRSYLQEVTYALKHDARMAITSVRDLGGGWAQVDGWAYDQSDITKPSSISVWASGNSAVRAAANLETPAAPVNGLHGFSVKTRHFGGVVSVCGVTGNAYGTGSEFRPACVTNTFSKLNNDAYGQVSRVKDLGNGYLEVTGWTVDYTDPTKAVGVSVWGSNISPVRVTGNLSADPMQATKKVLGNHRFMLRIKAPAPGKSVTYCGTVANSFGPGNHYSPPCFTWNQSTYSPTSKDAQGGVTSIQNLPDGRVSVRGWGLDRSLTSWKPSVSAWFSGAVAHRTTVNSLFEHPLLKIKGTYGWSMTLSDPGVGTKLFTTKINNYGTGVAKTTPVQKWVTY